MTIFNILNLIILRRFFLLLVDVGKEIEVGEENEEDDRIGHNDLERRKMVQVHYGGRTMHAVFNLL